MSPEHFDNELHRRLLKHRMMGAEDPVAQAFAFLGGLPATRFAAVPTAAGGMRAAAMLRSSSSPFRLSSSGVCPAAIENQR